MKNYTFLQKNCCCSVNEDLLILKHGPDKNNNNLVQYSQSYINVQSTPL